MKIASLLNQLGISIDPARQQAMVDAYIPILRPILMPACGYYLFVTWEHWQTQTSPRSLRYAPSSTCAACSKASRQQRRWLCLRPSNRISFKDTSMAGRLALRMHDSFYRNRIQRIFKSQVRLNNLQLAADNIRGLSQIGVDPFTTCPPQCLLRDDYLFWAFIQQRFLPRRCDMLSGAVGAIGGNA